MKKESSREEVSELKALSYFCLHLSIGNHWSQELKDFLLGDLGWLKKCLQIKCIIIIMHKWVQRTSQMTLSGACLWSWKKILKLHFKVNCKPTLLHKDWSHIWKSEGFCQKPGSRILNNCSNEVLLRSTEFIRWLNKNMNIYFHFKMWDNRN